MERIVRNIATHRPDAHLYKLSKLYGHDTPSLVQSGPGYPKARYRVVSLVDGLSLSRIFHSLMLPVLINIYACFSSILNRRMD